MTIKVETPHPKPGFPLVSALLGPDATLFEIRAELLAVHYFVESIPVSRQVYFDCVATAKMDQFDPEGHENVPPDDFEDGEPTSS